MARPIPVALVVDDEPQLRSIVSFALQTEGFECLEAGTAEAAWQLLKTHHVDIVLLDVMLPGASGIQLCRRVHTTLAIPVILLTARDAVTDRVAGLEAGADDYVCKPFSPRELTLRAQAIVRRSGDGEIRNGPLLIDSAHCRATWHDTVVRVSLVEARLLVTLAAHCDETVSFSCLLNEVWTTSSAAGGRQMVKTTVCRLRAKFLQAGIEQEIIRSVRGQGYLMPRLS